jgi:hypothetical protein
VDKLKGKSENLVYSDRACLVSVKDVKESIVDELKEKLDNFVYSDQTYLVSVKDVEELNGSVVTNLKIQRKLVVYTKTHVVELTGSEVVDNSDVLNILLALNVNKKAYLVNTVVELTGSEVVDNSDEL